MGRISGGHGRRAVGGVALGGGVARLGALSDGTLSSARGD